MKKCVSYLFIVILAIFTLPVKQLGDTLLKKNNTQMEDASTDVNDMAKQQQQMQEEVLHKCILPQFHISPSKIIIANRALRRQVKDSRLIPHFVPDIATPPPNYG